MTHPVGIFTNSDAMKSGLGAAARHGTRLLSGLASRLGASQIIARNLDGTMAKQLLAGSEHYTAYVGPPDQYDFMGATQFRLLCTLGLREHHRLLDFSCGSLRAGRLFIPYINPGHYYGVEPNPWLIEDAVKQEIGADIIQIKGASENAIFQVLTYYNSMGRDEEKSQKHD